MRLLKILLIASLFLYFFSFTFTFSNDFTQDLGRHLKLGEIIVKTRQIPNTNLFSYTNQNFPFLNHHWLSEVIFYLLTRFSGLNSLIFLKTILVLGAFAFAVKAALKKSGVLPTVISVLILSPLLLERNDIRPEVFGFLFFSIILYILFTYSKSQKLIYFLPVIMALWINIHISFIFGIFLIGLLLTKFLPDLRGQARTSKTSYRTTFFLFLSLLVLILNPHGLKGVLYPFNIFQNYGYTIVENQNIFFLKSLIFNPILNYFFLLTPLIIIAAITLLFTGQYIEIIILLTFSIAAAFQWRHLPFFVLAGIPILSKVTSYWFLVIGRKIHPDQTIKSVIFIFLIIINTVLIIFFLSNQYYLIYNHSKSFGVGYTGADDKLTDFVVKNNLQKNIFNNFDIGGYLIYKLYPQYTFFIDNRPEAYPRQFIENVYKGLQIDKNLQDKIFKKYSIKTVIFAYTDQTQWAEIFLRNIINDKNWRMVYVDKTAVIFSQDQELADIREKKDYFENLIQNNNNYLDLLILSRIFTLMDKNNFVEEVFTKAYELNPLSCAMKKYQMNRYVSQPSLYLYKAQELRENSWYCF